MRGAYGIAAAAALCLLALPGCRAAGGPGSRPGRALPPAARAAPEAADSGTDSAAAREARTLVNGFVRAVRKQDWTAAAQHFCSEFRSRHRKELLDGSLLRYDPHAGKSVGALLHDARCRVGRVTVRGDHAWAVIQVGGGNEGQAGRATLELVKERSRWRLLRFPPSPAAADAARAGHDSEAAGRWLLAMLADGRLSARERICINEVLPAYYALMLQLGSRVRGKPYGSPVFPVAATEEGLAGIARLLESQPHVRVLHVSFWPEPGAEMRARAKALAADALRGIHEDLMALRDKFPELAQLSGQHLELSKGRLWYAPNPPGDYQKFAKPTVGIWVHDPCLVTTQVSSPRILLPRAKIEVGRWVAVDDRQLSHLVKQLVERRTRALVRLEESLGSQPLRQYW